MGLFLLADGIHASFDKILARFFWEGISDKRSYHWVNWPEVCRPKDQGGLGIINSRVFNAALMSKWIWRIFNPDEHHNLWFKLLRAKYFNVDNIFARNSQGGSQFWRSLHKIKHLFKLGAKFTPGNGEKIFFFGPTGGRGRAPWHSGSLGFLISAALKLSLSIKPSPFLLPQFNSDDRLGLKRSKLGRVLCRNSIILTFLLSVIRSHGPSNLMENFWSPCYIGKSIKAPVFRMKNSSGN
jgi:hypothetical protein